jgi:uncharacterized protein (DUF362 family)
MTGEHSSTNSLDRGGISRRDFLKVAAAAGMLAGCQSAQQPTTTTTRGTTAAPMLTATSTPAPPPASTPIAKVRRPEIIQFYPDVPSKVVRAHHAGVWTGTPQGGTGDHDLLAPDALRQMLDASITELTGLNDVRDAWAALFSPDERIAIKVNTIRDSQYWTHVPLVMTVTECLQEAGIPAEQIVIFDRRTDELENAGFPINRDGVGARCYGTIHDSHPDYTDGWRLIDSPIGLSNVLLGCHALINMPVLKQHVLAGISFAMKNHYGTFNKPGIFHGRRVIHGIAELNALQPIKDRARLIIGDALTVVRTGGGSALAGDSILVSFDPVAHDAAGLQVYIEAMSTGKYPPSSFAVDTTNAWLAESAELGLGTNDPQNTDLVEINLG